MHEATVTQFWTSRHCVRPEPPLSVSQLLTFDHELQLLPLLFEVLDCRTPTTYWSRCEPEGSSVPLFLSFQSSHVAPESYDLRR